jgi:hypothetical protein
MLEPEYCILDETDSLDIDAKNGCQGRECQCARRTEACHDHPLPTSSYIKLTTSTSRPKVHRENLVVQNALSSKDGYRVPQEPALLEKFLKSELRIKHVPPTPQTPSTWKPARAIDIDRSKAISFPGTL